MILPSNATNCARTRLPERSWRSVFARQTAKAIYWDGNGIVLAYTPSDEHTFTWPGMKDGLMTLPRPV